MIERLFMRLQLIGSRSVTETPIHQFRSGAVEPRPDKFHATRTGGYKDVEIVFDGKTLTMNGQPHRLAFAV